MLLHPRALQRLSVVGFVVAALLPGCRGASPPHEEESPQAPVQATPARKIMLGEQTELLGTTQPLPNRSARISAVMEGHVESVLDDDGHGSSVVEGQQVKKGQVIVKLDDRVLRANRDRLQATLTDLAEQEKQAGFAVELASIDVRRLEELLRGNSGTGSVPLVSRVELEKARVLQKDAESKQKSMSAKREAMLADLKALDKQLAFFTLRAPIAGRLSIVQAVPGQTLTPGTVVADVVDLNEIDALCYAPPDAAARLSLDPPQSATLLRQEEATSGEQAPLQGKVVFIGVQAQAETGNIPIKVRFPNPKLRLRAHAVVRVQVLTQPEVERLTIPEAALMEDRDVPTVVAIQEIHVEEKEGEEHRLGKARILLAVLGVRDRAQGVVEILSLEDPATKEKVAPEGLEFVTAGGHGLKNDDVVTLQK